MYKNVVIIPSLNPNKDFINYVQKLIKNGMQHILVIDDGSDEDKKWIFDEIDKIPETYVCHHICNMGKGKSLKDAFQYVLKNMKDPLIKGVITVDSDGQHTVEDVIRIQKELDKSNNHVLILGTRNFKQKNVPIKSRFGNSMTSGVFKVLYGKYIHDTQTGLRGISKEYLSEYLKLEGERFEYETNMLIYAINHKHSIQEIEIETVYIDNNSETHFRPVLDSLKIYKLIFKKFFLYMISSLSSFIIDVLMFYLFLLVCSNMTDSSEIIVATVGARIISSLYNFIVNKKIVFCDTGKLKHQVFKYYCLCILQMCLSAGCVVMIHFIFKGNKVIEKMIVDTILFFISYHIQRLWIFKGEN